MVTKSDTETLLYAFWTIFLWTASPSFASPPRLGPVDLVAPAPDDAPADHFRLSIKLTDGTRITPEGQWQVAPRADDTQFQALLARLDVRFEPRFGGVEKQLAVIAERASRLTSQQQPDLAAVYDLVWNRPVTVGELRKIGAALQETNVVDWAFVRDQRPPPPGDIAPTTDDYEPRQGYLGPEPGLDADFAHSLGARGQDVRVSDAEYGWDFLHEDLLDADLTPEDGQTIQSLVYDYGWHDHGTAVMGILGSVANGYGVTGFVPEAALFAFPEYTVEEDSRRVAAITQAIANSDIGDVVLLEMQIGVVCESCYGPAELDPDIWSLVRMGTDAGVVIVGAAGNGGQDLDSGWYADNWATWGDSGAILVGAGSADSRHAPMYYSGHGTRVDVQGWGEDVFTAGYGDFAVVGGDDHQSYTAYFSGTSSASAVVAGAAALVQDYMVGTGTPPLLPSDLRDLLVSTGTPQSSGDLVGPLPNVRSAIEAFDADTDGYVALAYGGTDCDDARADAHPDAIEIWYDGVDQDCLGGDDDDADGDGIPQNADCDDNDPAVGRDSGPDCVDSSDKSSGCATVSTSRFVSWFPIALASLAIVIRRRRFLDARLLFFYRSPSP